jgi:serine/threonine protein kinase
MEGRTKVTKEVLCEESRFILANVMAEARYGRQNRFDDIRRVCEGAVSIPFSEYIGFLEAAGYLRHDRGSESLEVTPEGEKIVNGGSLNELTERAVSHFKNARARRRKEESRVSKMMPMTSSGGRDRIAVGGEIQQHSGEIVDSRYEKLATIGTGGVGTVYRARQVPLNREVALKEIRELFSFFAEEQHLEIIRRFTDVVRAAANLAHPNILPIHDVNLDRDHPYVVSELAPNGSARRLISDAEDIPVNLVMKYLLQALHALRAAHAQRVYHRSLKPENLLIDAYGNVKVSDFGFGRIVERDSAVIRQVYVGMGNIAYMAPELFTDPVGAGPQSDIYALGIIFYELLTRKLPGRRSVMPSEINDRLPKGIDDIFDRMTRDSRTERYTSVDDILADVDKLEGLSDVLDHQTQVLVAENPLEQIKFRESEEPSETPVAAEADKAPAAEGGDDKLKSGPSHRPYSFQQRKKQR